MSVRCFIFERKKNIKNSYRYIINKKIKYKNEKEKEFVFKA